MKVSGPILDFQAAHYGLEPTDCDMHTPLYMFVDPMYNAEIVQQRQAKKKRHEERQGWRSQEQGQAQDQSWGRWSWSISHGSNVPPVEDRLSRKAACERRQPCAVRLPGKPVRCDVFHRCTGKGFAVICQGMLSHIFRSLLTRQ